MQELKKEVQYIKGVGPSRAVLLNKLGIYTLEDLITYYPREYEDRGKPKLIANLEEGEEALIEAVAVSRMSETRIRKSMTIYKLVVRDESGTCNITWFNQSYLKNRFEIGKTYKFYGKVSIKYGKVEMNSPVFDDKNTSKNTGKIIPIYPLTYQLSQNTIRKIIENGLEIVKGKLPETLPEYIKQEYQLEEENQAVYQIHFPQDFSEFERARKRLVFEELLSMQLALMSLKNETIEETGIAYSKAIKMSDVINELPFHLTKAQLKVLEEIDNDMEQVKPMNRLLQGDVGSRKNGSLYNSKL
ncbi:MAG: OB-fold nucleic acid binding domain-containing protein [Clostridia bacterium]